MFFKDAQQIYRGCNKAFEAFLGRPREEIVNRTVFEVSPPDLAQRYFDQDQALLWNPGEQVYEAEVQTGQGRRAVVFHKATYVDDSGEVAGLVGVILDITDRRRAQDGLRGALQQMEALSAATELERRRLELILEHIDDGVVLVDLQGNFTFANPALRLMFEATGERGAPSSLAELRELYEIGYADDRPVTPDESPVMQALPGKVVTDLELHFSPRANGNQLTVLFNALPVRDAQGTVMQVVITMRDITERKAFEKQLSHLAFHDPLTGLANRALLADRVEHALSRARRRPAKRAIIYLDLDDFKRINDTQGHETGDRVLQEVASRLQGTLREEDTAARLGGDEFAILVEETVTVEDAAGLARRIEGELMRPIELPDGSLSIAASMGVVRADDPATGLVELLRSADIAMYVAKREARGGCRIFEQSMSDATVQRERLEEDLRHALDKGELALVFQPLVDLANRRSVGVEALLRWNHPRRGLVMPLTFIPLAEQSGEIERIGRWVLEETCWVVGGWNRQLKVPLRANVNVSVRQLVPSFVDEVAAILERTGFPPGLLVLELTQSMLVANPGNVIEHLARLRGLGVGVAIDNFGTGFSSLSHVQDLPVVEIKIDRSFVEALTQRGDATLVSTIIQLGQRLRVSVVAEGIEREDQATRLLALGCEFGQGYLFGRPAPGETVVERLIAGEGEPAIVTAVPGERSA